MRNKLSQKQHHSEAERAPESNNSTPWYLLIWGRFAEFAFFSFPAMQSHIHCTLKLCSKNTSTQQSAGLGATEQLLQHACLAQEHMPYCLQCKDLTQEPLVSKQTTGILWHWKEWDHNTTGGVYNTDTQHKHSGSITPTAPAAATWAQEPEAADAWRRHRSCQDAVIRTNSWARLNRRLHSGRRDARRVVLLRVPLACTQLLL